MDDVGLAGGAHLALVVLNAEVPRLADEANVVTGAVGLDLTEERFKTCFDGVGVV